MASRNYLEAYSDEENSVQPKVIETKSKKNKGKNLDYDLVQTFEDSKASLEWIKSKEIWSYSYTNKSEEGKKRNYRCNRVPKKANTKKNSKAFKLCIILLTQ